MPKNHRTKPDLQNIDTANQFLLDHREALSTNPDEIFTDYLRREKHNFLSTPNIGNYAQVIFLRIAYLEAQNHSDIQKQRKQRKDLLKLFCVVAKDIGKDLSSQEQQRYRRMQIIDLEDVAKQTVVSIREKFPEMETALNPELRQAGKIITSLRERFLGQQKGPRKKSAKQSRPQPRKKGPAAG